jgi:hypothetical protein
MLKQLVVLLLATLGLFGCSEDDQSTSKLAEGTYTGIFYRSSPNARWTTSDVQLTLENNRFSGSSSTFRYPAICEGTYQRTGSDSIQFTNECSFTADFDWTFILDGAFQIHREGQKMIISREYEGSVTDTYELERE